MRILKFTWIASYSEIQVTRGPWERDCHMAGSMSSFLPLFLSFLQLLSFMHYNLCFKYPFFPQKPYQPLRTPVINPKSQDGEPKVSEKELYVCIGVGIRVYNSYHISAIHIFPLAPSTWTHQSELSLTLSSACFLVPTLCTSFPHTSSLTKNRKG